MDNIIKIVRLQNGEDIIGYVTNNYDQYHIENPMSVDIEYIGNKAGLLMKQWLPLQLVKKSSVTLKEKDILFVVDPSDDFSEYYVHTVEKIAEVLDYKEKTKDMNEEEINIIMDAYEELATGSTLH